MQNNGNEKCGACDGSGRREHAQHMGWDLCRFCRGMRTECSMCDNTGRVATYAVYRSRCVPCDGHGVVPVMMTVEEREADTVPIDPFSVPNEPND